MFFFPSFIYVYEISATMMQNKRVKCITFNFRNTKNKMIILDVSITPIKNLHEQNTFISTFYIRVN